MMINDWDRGHKRSVSDQELNELFKEALKLDPSLMISQHTEKKGVFIKEIITNYSIFHECFKDGLSTYEARQQLSACGEKRIVMAYLYGIINGYNTAIKKSSS